jgi:hypothetical protein
MLAYLPINDSGKLEALTHQTVGARVLKETPYRKRAFDFELLQLPVEA